MPPAGLKMMRRNETKSSVGRNAANHNPAIIAVAEVDQGSEIASATARQSANLANCFQSKFAELFNVELSDKTRKVHS